MNTLLVLQMVIPAIIAFVIFHLLFFKSEPNRRLPPSPPSLPIIGHLHHLGPLIHQSFNRLSARYGPLIHLRLGSVSCVVADAPDLAQELLQKNDLAFANRKHTLAIDHVTYGVAFAFAPYGPYWRFIKKMSTVELLGIQNLGHFLPIRTQEIHGLLLTLTEKSKQKESVNMTNELLKLSNNVICQMMMGIRCSGNKSEAEEAKNLVREVTTIFGEFNVSDFIWFCKKLDLQGFKKRYEDIRTRYDALLERIIFGREEMRKEGKGMDGKGKDFLDMLLDVLEDDKAEIKITRNHIKALILDFVTAGTDTTAVIIEWTLVELIKNPTVMEKAKQELDEVIGNTRLVEESDASKLPYIQAIIKEAFRLHPPIPMIIRKSNENVSVKSGYEIPAGSILFVNNWSIGRNPKYWESPLEFKPDRFLEEGVLKPSLDIRGQNFQILPFGTGRRSCPGINMAMRQLPVVVSILIQCFEWTVNDKQVLNMDERGGLTAPRATDLVCFPLLRKNSPHSMFTSV